MFNRSAALTSSIFDQVKIQTPEKLKMPFSSDFAMFPCPWGTYERGSFQPLVGVFMRSEYESWDPCNRCDAPILLQGGFAQEFKSFVDAVPRWQMVAMQTSHLQMGANRGSWDGAVWFVRTWCSRWEVTCDMPPFAGHASNPQHQNRQELRTRLQACVLGLHVAPVATHGRRGGGADFICRGRVWSSWRARCQTMAFVL